MYDKWGLRGAIAALLFVGMLACRTADVFIAQVQPTETPTRTPRPTLTPLPQPTDTPVPTLTATPAPTGTATRRPPTPRPPTAKPPVIIAPPQPTVSTMEFHTNPVSCSHSGQTYIKGTVYLNRNDPNSRYAGAIIALGPPDGSTIYGIVKSGDDGVYTHVLGDMGQSKPGFWGVWLVTPSMSRKSDIAGPINTNDLPDGDPKSCWAAVADFWK